MGDPMNARAPERREKRTIRKPREKTERAKK
jgi:hypothetical protein